MAAIQNYRVVMTKQAEKDLEKLPEEVYEEAIKEMRALSSNPRPKGYVKLKAQRTTIYRITVRRDYRIVYTIENKILQVEIIMIGDRKNIYKRLKRRRIA